MSLPDNFSPAEHLQDTIRLLQNRIVKEEFSDVEHDDDIKAPRSSLKLACLHRDDDSLIMTKLRNDLFYIILRKAQDLQAPIYGTPITEFDRIFLYQPQIALFFNQNSNSVGEGHRRVEGEISFRLMHKTSSTLTHSDLETLAHRIKTNFATSPTFAWHKGKTTARYEDLERGYKLTLFVVNEAEAKRVIEQVLDIQSHTPNWEHLSLTNADNPSEKYPNSPTSVTILGKSRRKPRKRPVETVHFRRASLLVHGLPSPITLVDTTGRRKNAVLTV